MSAESNLPALQADLDRIAAEAQQVHEAITTSTSTSLVKGSAHAEQARDQMLAARRAAHEKADELADAADRVRSEIRSEMDRMRGEMEARMKAQTALLAPLQAQVKRMEEGIWTVNLYLGTSEEIVTLRDGAPAAADTPIHLWQRVLAMDEEVAAFPVEHGKADEQGMDYRDIGLFDEWIKDPEHLAQVAPMERSVVVLTPRATDYDYGDPMLNAQNKHNYESYWLIRNGEQVVRMSTDFKVGKTLMPTSEEFTALFRTTKFNPKTHKHDVVEIEPGTREWEKADKAQGAVQRHYMRVALILQGILDRTEVLAPLPGAINVMHQSAYDDGLVVVVSDAERQIASSREPYYEWIKRLNKGLRPGMRIIGTFTGSEWQQHEFRAEAWSSAEGNERLSPARAERPPRDTLLTIEARKTFHDTQGLVVRYPRTEAVYDPNMWVETRPGWGYRGGDRVPTTRASAVILPSDVTIIPFDLVTEGEMRAYLEARTERHAYAGSFPLLQAAIAAKAAEREAEAPFRNLIASTLTTDTGTEVSAADVDTLVHRWKLANKWHRPLVNSTPEEEAKALRMIRAEWKRITDSGATDARDAHAVEVLRDHDPAVMFVGRLSSGKYVAFAPQPRQYAADVCSHRLWVREYTTGKTASKVTTREWIVPGVRGNKMTALYGTEQWEGWDTIGTDKDDLTDTEMAEALTVAEVRCMTVLREHTGRKAMEVLVVAHDPAKRVLAVWASDGTRGVPPIRLSENRPTAPYEAALLRWRRTPEGIVFGEADHSRTLSGTWTWRNRHWAVNDQDAGWEMPWATRWSSHPHPLPVRIEQEALDATLAQAEAVRKAIAEVWEPGRGRVARTLHDVHDQQRAALMEKARVEFMREYPDEAMWEAHRPKVKIDRLDVIDPLDNWHFHGSKGTTLNSLLCHLADTGFPNWGGITIADAYEVAGTPLPDVYEPIAGLVLLDPDTTTTDDQEDEDEDDD